MTFEELAVDVAERLEVGGEADPLSRLGVEYVENLVEQFVDVLTALAAERADRVREAALVEDTRVLGEEAEQEP